MRWRGSEWVTPKYAILDKIILSWKQMRISECRRKSVGSFPYLTKSRNCWEMRTATRLLFRGRLMATKETASRHQGGSVNKSTEVPLLPPTSPIYFLVTLPVCYLEPKPHSPLSCHITTSIILAKKVYKLSGLALSLALHFSMETSMYLHTNKPFSHLPLSFYSLICGVTVTEPKGVE